MYYLFFDWSRSTVARKLKQFANRKLDAQMAVFRKHNHYSTDQPTNQEYN